MTDFGTERGVGKPPRKSSNTTLAMVAGVAATAIGTFYLAPQAWQSAVALRNERNPNGEVLDQFITTLGGQAVFVAGIVFAVIYFAFLRPARSRAGLLYGLSLLLTAFLTSAAIILLTKSGGGS